RTASWDEVPRIMRSGQLKSSIAQPSVKNIGWETMVACRLSFCKLFSRAEAVPTATGVTTDRTGGLGAKRAIRNTRSCRWLGESSARNIRRILRANDSMSVEYTKRPTRTLRRITSCRFFSKNGTLPCAISTMRELSAWQQETGVPKSARQAEITVPRYPDQ